MFVFLQVSLLRTSLGPHGCADASGVIPIILKVPVAKACQGGSVRFDEESKASEAPHSRVH